MFQKIKDFFKKSEPTNEVNIVIPNSENTTIEIKVTPNHVLDEFLKHENITISNDLVYAVELVKQKHLEFEKNVANIDNLQQRVLRTNEADKLISQIKNGLNQFIRIPHVQAVSQIVPEFKKNKLEIMIMECHKVADQIYQLRDNLQNVDSLNFLNSLKQIESEQDFNEVEPSGFDIYMAKLKAKSDDNLRGSDLLFKVLKIGVNVRKAMPDVLAPVLTNDDSSVMERAIPNNNAYEVGVHNKDDKNATMFAMTLTQDFPKLKALHQRLTNRYQNNAEWLNKAELDVKHLKEFEEYLKNRPSIFEDGWESFHYNLSTMLQVIVQLKQNAGIIDEHIRMVDNILKNEESIKRLLGLVAE